MKIDRLLFLGLTATITAAAGCTSETTGSVFDDVAASGAAKKPASEDAPSGAAARAPSAAMDSRPASVLGLHRPAAKTAAPAPEGSGDPPGDPGPDPVPDPDPVPVDPTIDGDVDELCAPFTEELSSLVCHAAFSAHVQPAVRSALYPCASAADIPACALGAFALGTPFSFSTNPLCEPLVACETASPVSAFQCSQAVASLEPSGVTMLQGALDLSCDDSAYDFVRYLLLNLDIPWE